MRFYLRSTEDLVFVLCNVKYGDSADAYGWPRLAIPHQQQWFLGSAVLTTPDIDATSMSAIVVPAALCSSQGASNSKSRFERSSAARSSKDWVARRLRTTEGRLAMIGNRAC